MRYVAIHDRRGKIASLISGPDDGPPATIALEPGLEATEVDLSETGLDASAFETEEGAIKALEAFRVDVRREAKLVRRDAD
jgi:hypothetical protein